MSFLTLGSVAIPSVVYPGRVVKLPPYVSKGRVELKMWPLPHTGSRAGTRDLKQQRAAVQCERSRTQQL